MILAPLPISPSLITFEKEILNRIVTPFLSILETNLPCTYTKWKLGSCTLGCHINATCSVSPSPLQKIQKIQK